MSRLMISLNFGLSPVCVPHPQIVHMLSHEAKKKKLLSLLDSGLEAPIIVFVNMKKGRV